MRKDSKWYVNSIVLTALCLAPLQSGCAARTTKTSKTETHASADAASDQDRHDTQEVTKTETVVEQDTHKGFFGIIGDIIALPFRAIASIL